MLGAHPLELVEVPGGLDRGQRSLASGLDLLGLERGDLDGVVGGVRARHDCLSRVSAVSAQSRNSPDTLANRFRPAVRSLRPVVLLGPQNRDARATGRRVVDLHGAAVSGDQAVDDVHAETGAAAGAVLPELGEDPAADRGADALALVVDVQHDTGVRRLIGDRRSGQAYLSIAMPDGVVHQVGDYLSELVRVGADRRKLAEYVERDLPPGPGANGGDNPV